MSAHVLSFFLDQVQPFKFLNQGNCFLLQHVEPIADLSRRELRKPCVARLVYGVFPLPVLALKFTLYVTGIPKPSSSGSI